MAERVFPLAPGATIGILGGGQLGRMLALAAARLGFHVAILAPERNEPALRVARYDVVADYRDADALKRLSDVADVIGIEFENVPAEALETLTRLGAAVAPGPRALRVTQDRVLEKTFANEIGVETVAFAAIETEADLGPALERIGAPALLKTRREGYDGKGQAWIRTAEEGAEAFRRFGGRGCVLEARAAFVRELSVIAARGRDGAVACYPVGENVHENGVLRTTTAPAPNAETVQDAAEAIARKVLEGLDYVGVLGVELFELADGRLLLNEIAPRVHNTGHWTQDGAVCDQFEQHVRALAGWPLGSTRARCRTVMQNLLGPESLNWFDIAAEPDARLHLYGKDEPRAGRKMGHVNRLEPTPPAIK